MIPAMQLRVTKDHGALLTAGTLNWAGILHTWQTPQTQSTLKGDLGDERIDPKAEIRTRYGGRQLGGSIGRLRGGFVKRVARVQGL